MDIIQVLNGMNKVKNWFNNIKSIDFNSTLILNSDSELNISIAKLLLCYKMCKRTPPCLNCSSCVKIINNTAIDVKFYPIAKNIAVSDANDIVESMSVSPFEFKNKYYILNNFNDATVQAQNKLLKSLEEPSERARFILFSRSKNNILPTVLSRMSIIRFPVVEFDDIKEYLINNNFDKEKIKNEQIKFSLCNNKLSEYLINLESDEMIEKFNSILKLLVDFNASNQVLDYSILITQKYKNVGEFFDFLTNVFDVVINNKTNNEQISNFCNHFNTLMINKIIDAIQKANKYLESNVSSLAVLDCFLINILEVKYKCKK